MKRSIFLAATVTLLSLNAPGAYARGEDAGAAAAAGFVGGLFTGLLLDAPPPRVYRPGPLVIERYYDDPPPRHWRHEHRRHHRDYYGGRSYDEHRWHDHGRRDRWD